MTEEAGRRPRLLLHPSLRRLPALAQVQFLSPRARRRVHAALASCATSMLILSNLVFLGGSHVGKIYWDRIFLQGKPPGRAVRGPFLSSAQALAVLDGFGSGDSPCSVGGTGPTNTNQEPFPVWLGVPGFDAAPLAYDT